MYHREQALEWLKWQYTRQGLTPPQFLGDGQRSTKGFYTIKDRLSKGKVAYTFDVHDGKAITVTFVSFKDGGFKTTETFIDREQPPSPPSQPTTPPLLPTTLSHPPKNFSSQKQETLTQNQAKEFTQEYQGQIQGQEQEQPIQPPQPRTHEEIERNRLVIQASYESFPSLEAGQQHAYLTKKGIVAHPGLKLKKDYKNPAIIIPSYSSLEDYWIGRLSTYQEIYARKKGDSDKFFCRGGKMTGSFFPIGLEKGKEYKKLYLVEGYATGCTVKKYVDSPVFVAFNAGNLKPVAEQLRRDFPLAQIIIAADNDQWKESEGKGNAGKSKAFETASNIEGVSVVFPSFNGFDVSGKPTDFNDLEICLLNFQKTLSETLRDPQAIVCELTEQLTSLETWYQGKERYLNLDLSIIDEYDAVLLKTPMGSGKTELMINLTKKYGDSYDVLHISPRQSLIDDTKVRQAAAGNEFVDYRENAGGTVHKYIVCCNSLTKSPKFSRKKLLVVDEVNQVLSQLCRMKASDGDSLEPEYEYLRNLIRESKVIAADANLNWISKEVINELKKGKKILSVTSSYNPPKGTITRFWESKGELVEDATKSLQNNKQILFACSSLIDVNTIYERFKAAGFTNGLVISSETKNDEKELAFLKDPNVEAHKYQYIIYSPAISSGLSLNETPNYRPLVYGVFTSKAGPTAEDAWQQLGRYRGACNIQVFVGLDRKNEPTTYEDCLVRKKIAVFQVLDELRVHPEIRDELLNLMKSNDPDAIFDFFKEKLQTPYLRLQVMDEMNTNKLNNDFFESFREINRRIGHKEAAKEIVDIDFARQQRLIMKDFCKTAEFRYTRLLMDAPNITKEEAEKISKENATSTRLFSLEKFEINEFYGEFNIDIVKDDDRGKLRRKLRKALEVFYPDKASLRDAKDARRVVLNYESVGNLKPHFAPTIHYNQILKFSGYELAGDDGFPQYVHDKGQITTESLIKAGFIDWVNQYKDELSVIHQVPNNVSSKPIRYLNQFLDDIGLNLYCKVTRINGKLENLYNNNTTAMNKINKYFYMLKHNNKIT